MTKGSTAAEKAKWRALRERPKKLTVTELHQLAVARRDQRRYVEKMQMEMRKAGDAGDIERRSKARGHLRDSYETGLAKNRDLGIAPIYRGHTRDHARNGPMQIAWERSAREWDRTHQR